MIQIRLQDIRDRLETELGDYDTDQDIAEFIVGCIMKHAKTCGDNYRVMGREPGPGQLGCHCWQVILQELIGVPRNEQKFGVIKIEECKTCCGDQYPYLQPCDECGNDETYPF